MEFIRIAPKIMVRQRAIAQVVELKDLADISALMKARRECNVEKSNGCPYRTAVFFQNGKILLTPYSAKTIFARIQLATS